MKVYIEYNITNGPHGGGNQFLRNLKREFVRRNLYTDTVEKADIILFNSHHNADKVLELKRLHPEKYFIHRTDGLPKLYNKPTDSRQDIIFFLNRECANGTVFQTQWAREKHQEFGLETNVPNTVIVNAVDNTIFSPTEKKINDNKVKLVCTSWSTNKNKGFDTYAFLDENLNFEKYSFTLVGQQPNNHGYKNIKTMGPHTTLELAARLGQMDIFITASKHDCCSNSLLEALTSGLPVVALKSGGAPEIIGEGGALFEDHSDILQKIDLVVENIEEYKRNIHVPVVESAASQYLEFFQGVMNGSN